MREYSFREVSNGWVVSLSRLSIYDCEPLENTFAPTIGEAFELIRKHDKRVGDLRRENAK